MFHDIICVHMSGAGGSIGIARGKAGGLCLFFSISVNLGGYIIRLFYVKLYNSFVHYVDNE